MSAPVRPDRRLPQPQFSIRTLLLGVTLLSLLLGASRVLPASWIVLLLLLSSVIGAHLFGNYLGTRLRDGVAPAKRPPRSPLQTPPLQPTHFAPHTSLRKKGGRSWWLPLVALLGMFVGMGSGWYTMYQEYGANLKWPAVVVTLCACGSLGGSGAFLIAGFLATLVQAWREAIQHR
jgi:hypothetical protein